MGLIELVEAATKKSLEEPGAPKIEASFASFVAEIQLAAMAGLGLSLVIKPIVKVVVTAG